jgi:alkyl hydroperoxide reductase subunit AhpF
MMLSEPDRKRVQQMLGGMVDPVRLVFFTQSLNCESCAPTRQILDEIASLADKLSLDERNFVLDKEGAALFDVDRVPAIAVVARERDTGIRFYGAPAGYEFSALLDAIVSASKGQAGLSDASRQELASIAAPVRIKVFVTPT